MTSERVLTIRDGSIRLGQALKLADLADSGTDAKDLIAAGEVRVNGEVDVRRGRQLVSGDIVQVADRRVVIESDWSDTGR